DEPLEPCELVVELRPGLRIAVRQIQRRDDEPLRPRLDVAAVRVVRIARDASPALDGLLALREDRDAVPRALAVPDRAVAEGLDRLDRKRLVRRFQLLEAGDVGRFLLEPLEETGQPGAYAVDVERCDLHC